MVEDNESLEGEEEREAIKAGNSKPWLDMIREAEKAFEDWQSKADNIDKQYADMGKLANTGRDREFAIFWANVQVLGPSIYSRPPVPVVVPRFKDRRPIPRTTSELLERAATVGFEMEDIDQVMRLIRDDVNVPGRGQAWVRYEHKDGKERACIEHKDRHDFLHGPARNWKEVPWVAAAAYMTEDEMETRFKRSSGDAYKDAVYQVQKDAKEKGAATRKEKAKVWELWHKGENKVVWVTEGPDVVLDEGEPHLTLEGFFPCPRPAYATVQRGSLMPVPDFLYYKDQIEEINELTARISALAEAVRVRGFYPAGAGEAGDAIEAALNITDNRKIMVPISNFAAFGNGSAKDTIIWLPIDMIVATIQSLVELRKQLISDVYEITGLSDIMRGSTEASETATAQKLKSQYGSVRIRDKQNELVRIARDICRIVAEIMAENFSKDTLLDMTQMELPSDADITKQVKGIETQAQKLQAELKQAQSDPEAQQLAQKNPEGAKQIIGQVQGQLQQLQAQAEKARQTVTIDQVMALLREQRMRPFVLDIETDSTIQPDEDAEKQRRAEFMQVFGTVMSELGQLVSSMPQSAGFAGEVLKFALKPYRAGRELEGAIDDFVEQMQGQAGQQKPNPELQQAQMESQAKQAELQITAQKNAADNQTAQMQIQAGMRKADQEFQIKQAQLASSEQMEKWKAQLSSLTSIEVAKISAAQQSDSDTLQAQLEASLGFAKMQHEKDVTAMKVSAEQARTDQQLSAQAEQADADRKASAEQQKAKTDA